MPSTSTSAGRTGAVTVGLDGSPESLAAAEWAAREAALRGAPLKLVSVWEPVPMAARAAFLGEESRDHWSGRIPAEAAAGVRESHPELDVTADQSTGRPGEVLARLAEESALLVLGSRGLSGFRGFLVGSVGQAVLAETTSPVVFVRAPEDDGAGGGEKNIADGPVVLGIDAHEPDDVLLRYAFEAAARRGVPLRVVHVWSLPPYFAYGLPQDPVLDAELAKQEAAALTEVLAPWRAEHPGVEVAEAPTVGKTADVLVEAANGAALLVVGRRMRRAPFGGRIGSVAHAVLHHSTAPVAVVPHN
ncbi:universal stress protein [Streptomyces qinzhouensis]|uniref:Universal stress protein n=1 Tax=Streptomyces qinzhouensis TaxID=2599401 RepID=A0A5B8J2B4_9ACTN|nr:universal stress protein [Streptomyces qinzhouensis]QDY75367.1 universal stress protein [Streptomyces qinzhouensis]